MNDLITFTGSAPTGSSFAWSFGGGVATPGTGSGPQSVHWTSTGTKTVTLTVDNFGCNTSYSDTVLVRDLTGTNQINNPAFSISINPNPNDGSFELQFGKPISNSIIVKILDMDGRIVYNQEFGNANNSKIAIKATDLTSGNYLINVLLDGNTVTKKITISR